MFANAQYLLGQLFADKGYKVSYDLSFYSEWGDLTYRFARNFDLLKAFPYLALTQASKFKISIYKERFFTLVNNSRKRTNDYFFMQRKPPVYLGGYYHWYQDIWLAAFKEQGVDAGIIASATGLSEDQIAEL